MKIIYVPCKDSSEAKLIARSIIEAKLSACVNIIPSIFSVYRWKGKIEEQKEALIIIKTRSNLVDRVVSHIQRIHSYNTPEIIIFDKTNTTKAIDKWLGEELTG